MCSGEDSCDSCLSRNTIPHQPICLWSPLHRKCMKSEISLIITKQPLLSTAESCVMNCSAYTSCLACQSQSECGWAHERLDTTGSGVCARGNLAGSTSGRVGNYTWSYLTCPPEDECSSGHHTCLLEGEMCVDLPAGKPYYRLVIIFL